MRVREMEEWRWGKAVGMERSFSGGGKQLVGQKLQKGPSKNFLGKNVGDELISRFSSIRQEALGRRGQHCKRVTLNTQMERSSQQERTKIHKSSVLYSEYGVFTNNFCD